MSVWGGEGVCLGGVCLDSVYRGVSAQGRWCLPRGGGVCPGEGVSAQGRGCLPRGGGVCPGEGVSARGVSGRHPPVNRMTDRQTPVKILNCRNFVADGNNHLATRIYGCVLIIVTTPCLILPRCQLRKVSYWK